MLKHQFKFQSLEFFKKDISNLQKFKIVILLLFLFFYPFYTNAQSCTSDSDCPPNAICNTASGECVCNAGYFDDGTGNCVACSSIANCTSIICSNASDALCLSCESAFYIDQSGDCQPCLYTTSNVPAGYYLSSACDGNTTSDVSAIAECTQIANCNATETCTKSKRFTMQFM